MPARLLESPNPSLSLYFGGRRHLDASAAIPKRCRKEGLFIVSRPAFAAPAFLKNLWACTFKLSRQYYQPLRFYVKSILVHFRRSKNYHFNNFEGFEFWFLWKIHIWKCQKLPKIKIQGCRSGPNGRFWYSKVTKNWFHVKSEW